MATATPATASPTSPRRTGCSANAVRGGVAAIILLGVAIIGLIGIFHPPEWVEPHLLARASIGTGSILAIVIVGWIIWEIIPFWKQWSLQWKAKKVEIRKKQQDRREERRRVAEARRGADHERRVREAGPVGMEIIV